MTALARAAAVALRRLAEQMRGPSCACPPERPVTAWIGTPPPGWKPGEPAPHVCPASAAALLDARREAVTALEALRDALPLNRPIPWMETVRQVRTIESATADDCTRWATAWDAWAEAQR